MDLCPHCILTLIFCIPTIGVLIRGFLTRYLTKPHWLEHFDSQERAGSMGLVGEPKCSGCAEYVYSGTSFGDHDSGCCCSVE